MDLGKKQISLKEVFNLSENRGSSGRGAVGGGFPHSTHVQSRLPSPWPRSGQSGTPNQSASMMGSRLMQNTSTEEDIKYWMGDPDDPEDVGATFNPPYQFPSYYTDYMRTSHHWDSSPAMNEAFQKICNNILKELKDAPLLTSAGRFIFKGKSGLFDVFVSPYGIIVGVVPKGDGFSAYNFDDALWADGATPEEAVASAVTSEELDEISAVGGGAIAGHIGPLGPDNQSPYLKKGKKKKNDEQSIRAFGGGSINEDMSSPYRGGVSNPTINWNFWKYFDDAIAAGLNERTAAKHAKKETITDLRKSLMEIGRSKKAEKTIEKLYDYTNEAYLDIQRVRSGANIDLGSHWTRRYQEIKI